MDYVDRSKLQYDWIEKAPAGTPIHAALMRSALALKRSAIAIRRLLLRGGMPDHGVNIYRAILRDYETYSPERSRLGGPKRVFNPSGKGGQVLANDMLRQGILNPTVEIVGDH